MLFIPYNWFSILGLWVIPSCTSEYLNAQLVIFEVGITHLVLVYFLYWLQKGDTALHVALKKHGDTEICEALLQTGADIYLTNKVCQ